MSSAREFDIVLYGATGFVGKLTAQYLADAGGAARIALAGRSQDKLLAVRETLGETAQAWPLITADASQPSTLNAMAARTQVVVTTVGPYTATGCRLSPHVPRPEPITPISPESRCSCATASTTTTSRPSTPARASCTACGFDSIPSDLTVYALYRQATEDARRRVDGDTSFVVRKMVGGLSGGTVASIDGCGASGVE